VKYGFLSKDIFQKISCPTGPNLEFRQVRTLKTYSSLRQRRIIEKEDLYKTLKIVKEASQAEIKTAYFSLSKVYHPDQGLGDDEKFKEITAAYKILGDEQKRRAYDKQHLPPSEEEIKKKSEKEASMNRLCLDNNNFNSYTSSHSGTKQKKKPSEIAEGLKSQELWRERQNTFKTYREKEQGESHHHNESWGNHFIIRFVTRISVVFGILGTGVYAYAES